MKANAALISNNFQFTLDTLPSPESESFLAGLQCAAGHGFDAGMGFEEIYEKFCSIIPRGTMSKKEIMCLIDPAIALFPESQSDEKMEEPDATPNHQQGEVKAPVPEAIDDTSNKGIVESLNKYHAIIILSGRCLILNKEIDPTTKRPDISFSTTQDFKARYQNRKVPIETKGRTDEISIAEIWLDSPQRKEYEGIVFDPSGEKNPKVYNLWQGFSVQPKQGSWKRMQNHIRKIICTNDPETYQYLMAWLARLAQDPGGKRPGVVPVLRGKQGVGKGIFVNNLGVIFGSHFKHIISYHLVAGRFNSHFKNALLVFVDEGFWGGDKQSEGILKGMITEDFITVEPKGKEAFTIQNHSNFIFASNNDWIVPAATEERRFFVLDVSDAHMGDAAYFRALQDEMDGGGREAMLYDLLHHNIAGIDLRAFPRRQALLDQILLTWSADNKFWYEMLRGGSIDVSTFSTEWPEIIECKRLYELYTEFATNAGDRFKSTDRVFGRKIRALCPAISRKQKGDGKWYYFLPSLADCRDSLETMLKIKIDWDEEA